MNSLEEILKNEKESTLMLEKACEDARKIEANAQEKRVAQIAESKNTSSKSQTTALADQKQELAKTYQKTLNQESKRVDNLRVNAQAKINSAIRFVVGNI